MQICLFIYFIVIMVTWIDARPPTNLQFSRILTTRTNKTNVNRKDVILFPSDDSTEDINNTEVHIDFIPKCADGQTFCENIETYPYKKIRDVLHKTKSRHNGLFNNAEELVEDESISQRIGDAEETYFCASYDKIIYPKVGKTKTNKWKYIINQGRDGYIQAVRVETCRTPNQPCDLIVSLPDGYTTQCKQKFVYRRMLSLSEDGQTIPDTFLMPSGCCCSYKRDFGFLAKFGDRRITPIK